jgi:uncharacterized protein YigA (DUF484 family)
MTTARRPPAGLSPITEDDIVAYLANTPDFFERHAELLAQVQLSSPHGARAISLQERQAQMLREKIKVLETRVMDMVRHGTDNTATADRLHAWTRGLLALREPRELPECIAADLRGIFGVAQVAIKVWDCHGVHAREPFAQGASSAARAFANSLVQPYCGVNAGFEAVGWLLDPPAAQSIALLPLRAGAGEPAFGLLVLGSPDAQRFHADVGLHFLTRIAESASAALSRLQH